MRKKKLRFGGWDRRTACRLGAMLVALCLILCGDRLAAAYVSPQGIFLRGLPAAVTAEKSEAPKKEKPRAEVEVEILQAEEDVREEVLIELLQVEGTSSVDLKGTEPKVLIYHTHGTEAYRPTEEAPYEKTSDWRTEDEQNNIVRVGAELARILREEYGVAVLHDTTNHEPPRLGTAYERSVETMERYLEEYPSIELFIDVHRDAYELEGEVDMEAYAAVDDAVTIGEVRCARLMFVVGTGQGKTGAGFSVKPNYKENYALALALTEYMSAFHQEFMRPIRVKTGRYNQHVGKHCLLVEVGHNANTLQEALNAIPYLAEALVKAGGAG